MASNSSGFWSYLASLENATTRVLTSTEEKRLEEAYNASERSLACLDRRDFLIDFDSFTSVMTLVSSLVIVGLCFLKLRKSKRDYCWTSHNNHACYKRPGLAYPIKMIEESRHRFLNICGFCVSGWIMTRMASGEFTFRWMEGMPSYLSPLLKLFAAYEIGLLYYPIFSSLASDSIIGYCIGAVYTWILGIVFIIQRIPCYEYVTADVVAVQIIAFLPIVIFFVILGVFFPFQAIKRLIFVRTMSTDYTNLEDTPEFSHVEGLLRYLGEDYTPFNPKKYESHFPRNVRGHLEQESKERSVSDKGSIAKGRHNVKSFIIKKVYAPSSDFRYSLTVLSAAALSWLAIFVASSTLLGKWLQFRNYFRLKNKLGVIGREIYNGEKLSKEESSYEFFGLLEQRFKHYGWFQNLRNLVGELKFWTRTVEVCFYLSVVVAALFCTISIFLVLRSYKRDLFLMYRGIYRYIPENPDQGPVSVCDQGIRFVGYQVGYAVAGFILMAGILFLVTLGVMIFMSAVFRYKQYEWLKWLALKLLPILISLFVIKMAQKLLIRFCFLQRDKTGKLVLALDNRRAFFVLQYFMVYMNVALGIISAIVTMVKSAVCGLLSIGRLDMSSFPRHFEFMDGGFIAYCSMLKLDNVQRNPVLNVYTTLCLQQIRERRKTFDKKGNSKNTKAAWMRKEQIANKWALLYTLSKNPGLQLYRKLPQVKYDATSAIKNGSKLNGSRNFKDYPAKLPNWKDGNMEVGRENGRNKRQGRNSQGNEWNNAKRDNITIINVQ